MTDVHVTQFDGSRCAPYNCAAASGTMAVGFAGGPLLAASQFRAESGISCVPGVDTISGGLRIADVERVAAAHGVTLNYGRKPDGSYTSWSRDTLRQRLVAGDGCILLGDCQDAPVNPTQGVVLHSAFVHGLDANNRTHWHDPRLAVAYWITLDDVIRYWESFNGSQRFAGFVAPNQAGSPPDTGADVAGPIATNPRRTMVRQVTGISDGAYRRCFNVKGELFGIPTDVREVFAIVDMLPFTASNPANTNEKVTFSGEMFQIGGNEVTYAYPRDVNLVAEGTPPVNATKLTPGLYEVE